MIPVIISLFLCKILIDGGYIFMPNNDSNNKDLTNKKINEANVSVYAYDLAIAEDLKARFKKTDKNNSQVNDTVRFVPTENAFRIIGSLNEDNVVMPFITLQRLDWQLNLDRQMFQTFLRR